jgi:hypothetical protein
MFDSKINFWQREFFKSFLLFAFGIIPSADLRAFPFDAHSDKIPPVELARTHMHLESPKYCGVESVYLLIKLFGGEINMRELFQAFPEAEKQGTSLNKIQSFLEKRGFFCKLAKLNDKTFLKDHPKAKIIVLSETEEGQHVFLKHFIAPTKLQILDSAGEVKSVDENSFSEIPEISLIVSKQPIKEEITPYSVAMVFLITSIFGLCSVFLLNLFKCHKHSQQSMSIFLFLCIGFPSLFSQKPLSEQKYVAQNELVSCETPFFDAGTVKTGTGEAVIKHSFVLKNNSQKVLKIVELVASCTCADVSTESFILAPGAETRILATMTLTSSSFSGRTAEILVFFEDHDKEKTKKELSLHAKAEYAPYITPGLIDFGIVQANDATPKYRTFFVCAPSQIDAPDFIQTIESKFPKSIFFKVDSQTKATGKTAKGESFYFYVARVRVMLTKYEEHFYESPVGVVKIKDGPELPIRLGANVINFPIFSPQKVKLSSEAPNDTIQVTYNSASGGIPVSAHMIGDSVQIKEVKKLPPYYVYVLAYKAPKNFSSTLEGTKQALIITLEGGKEHILAVEIEDQAGTSKKSEAQ